MTPEAREAWYATPRGGAFARAVEAIWPRRMLAGAMLAIAADVVRGNDARPRGTLAP